MGLLSSLFRRNAGPARSEWLDGLMRSTTATLQAEITGALRTASRSFEAADTPVWAESWQTTTAGINDELAAKLPTLRARSRAQARSNEWAVGYKQKLIDHVLGDAGIRLQLRLTRGDGSPNTRQNDLFEAGWTQWGRAADVSGLAWAQVEKLALLSLVIDGEILYRLRPGSGPMGFQIQFLPADVLDVNCNREYGANRVRMGVEINDEGARVAYWIKAQAYGVDASQLTSVGQHLRIPASEIVHGFEHEEIGQLRGYPWLSAGARRLWLLSDFEQSAAVASSNAAKRQGFFYTPDGEAPRGFVDRYISTALERARAEGKDLTTEELNRITAEAEKFATAMPGQFDTLPIGYQFQPFESKWPEVSAEGYVKQHVRGWAAARGMSYVTLGNDLEAVNYSSAQVGIVAERDRFKAIQTLLKQHLHRPVIEAVAKYVVAATPGLNPTRLDAYLAAVTWQPRRWSGIDPVKAANANAINLGNKTTSRRRILLDQGLDPDEIFAEIADEERLFGPVAPPKGKGTPPADDATGTSASATDDDDPDNWPRDD